MNTTWIQTTPISLWKTRYRMGKRSGPANLMIGQPMPCAPWEGFGGCLHEQDWLLLLELDEEAREAVLDDLFGPQPGCRLLTNRVSLGASAYAQEWYCGSDLTDYGQKSFDFDRDRKHLIPYLQHALQRSPAMNVTAMPWSPPPWMKTPAVYNAGTLRQEDPVRDAYALYLLRYLQDYYLEGIEISGLHLQHAPRSEYKFPSCRWQASEAARFLTTHLLPLLEKENRRVPIWLGSLERDDYDGWLAPLLADETLLKECAGVSLQGKAVHTLARLNLAYPAIPIAHTLQSGGTGTNSWSDANRVFNELHHALTHGVSTTACANLILDPNAQGPWGAAANSLFTIDPASRNVRRNPEYYVVRHFSQYIQPGARSLLLSGPWAAHSVAFRNPDGSEVVVLHNPLEEACTLHLSGEDQGGISASLEPHSFHTFVLN